MNVFHATTVDGVWRQAHAAIMAAAANPRQAGRGGETIELLHVGLEVDDPRQRWVVSRRPGINPAFAIADALWLLAGSNYSNVMNFWFKDLPKFSGNGPTYAGAYGHRLRKHFGVDQLQRAYEILSFAPHSRQVVLQYWDVLTDMPYSNGSPRSADVPCNIMSLLKVRDGRLEWAQILRSNDLYRGLPNNFVQFTLLQEILAGWLNLEVGGYHQWSDSLHIYADSLDEFSCGHEFGEELNTDSLAVPVEQGQKLINEMYHRMMRLTTPELSEKQISEIATMDDAPIGYQNLLRVLAAESARRHGNKKQARELMKDCSNPQLIQVWSAWLERIQGVPTMQLLSSSLGVTT